MSELNPRFVEVVSSICEKFVAENDGNMPSMSFILSQTDEFSSTSTAHKYFLYWKESYDAQNQKIFEQTGLSDEFNNALIKEVSRFTTAAEMRYRQKAEDARSQAVEAVKDLEIIEDKWFKQEALVDSLRQKIADLEKIQTELTSSSDSAVAELRQQIEDKAANERELVERNERLQTELAKSELRMENNDKLADEIKETNKGLIKTNKEHEKEIIALSKTIATLETRLQGKEELVKSLKGRK